MRTRTAVLAAASLLIPLVPLAPAPALAGGWQTVDSYASPTGDVAYGIQRKGQLVRFDLSSFVDFGTVKFCVRKTGGSWTCRSKALEPTGKYDIYRARIKWQGNYPTGGSAERQVRFMKGSPILSFIP